MEVFRFYKDESYEWVHPSTGMKHSDPMVLAFSVYLNGITREDPSEIITREELESVKDVSADLEKLYKKVVKRRQITDLYQLKEIDPARIICEIIQTLDELWKINI